MTDETEPTDEPDESFDSDELIEADAAHIDQLDPDGKTSIKFQRYQPGPGAPGNFPDDASYRHAEIEDHGASGETVTLRLSLNQAFDMYRRLGGYLTDFEENLAERFEYAGQAYLVWSYPEHDYDPKEPAKSPYEKKLVTATLSERQAHDVVQRVHQGEYPEHDPRAFMIGTIIERVPLNLESPEHPRVAESANIHDPDRLTKWCPECGHMSVSYREDER